MKEKKFFFESLKKEEKEEKKCNRKRGREREGERNLLLPLHARSSKSTRQLVIFCVFFSTKGKRGH